MLASILNVPFERRIQMTTMIIFVILAAFAPWYFIYLLFHMLFATKYWYIAALYIAWFVYDFNSPKTGGYGDNWFRHSKFFHYFASYFPIKLVKTAEIPPEHNYIIGCHPHGISSISHFVSLSTDATEWPKLFPGIKSYMCALNAHFIFPFRREMTLFCGLISVSANSIEYTLNQKSSGQAVGIAIGGTEELLDARPNCYDTTIKKRKGFVKLALKNGAHLIPIYSFGENDIFNQVDNRHGTKLRKFQDLIKKYCTFCIPPFYGRAIFNHGFGIMPFRHPIYTVVGKPIPVTKTLQPTQEQIDEIHTKYCDELVNLFEENKEKYGVSKNVHLNLC